MCVPLCIFASLPNTLGFTKFIDEIEYYSESFAILKIRFHHWVPVIDSALFDKNWVNSSQIKGLKHSTKIILKDSFQ